MAAETSRRLDVWWWLTVPYSFAIPALILIFGRFIHGQALQFVWVSFTLVWFTVPASLLWATLIGYRMFAFHTVPADKRAQLIYLRAGNSSPELAFVSIMQGGKAMRTFPVGARAAIHVPLAVVEDLEPDTVIQVFYGAAEGVSGTFILDIGLIEI